MDTTIMLKNRGEGKKDRIVWFDNIKFFLMLLCVVGHFALYDKTSNLHFIKSLFLFIHTFHMQMFILISGMFYSKNKTKINVIYYLIIFIIMKLILDIINNIFFKVSNFAIFDTNNIYWFVWVLAVCNILMYIVEEYNFKIIFIVSISMALLAGFDKNAVHQFAIQRISVFFPLFLLGNKIGINNIVRISNIKIVKVLSLLFIIIYMVVLIEFINNGIYGLIDYFSGSKPYSLTSFKSYGILIRFFSFYITIIVGFSFMFLVPKFEIPFISRFGTKTMQVYFYHFFLRTIMRSYGLLSIKSIYNFFVLLFFSIILTFVLSTEPFDFPVLIRKKLIDCPKV